MGLGSADAFRAVAKQAADQQKDVSARRERLRERVLDRSRADRPVPVEPLGCPGCQTEYAFGSVCPDCDLPLSGVSLVVPVEAPSTAQRRYRAVAGLFTGVLLALLSLGVLAGSFGLVGLADYLDADDRIERVMMPVPHPRAR